MKGGLREHECVWGGNHGSNLPEVTWVALGNSGGALERVVFAVEKAPKWIFSKTVKDGQVKLRKAVKNIC
jgi:hypothetical protein